VDQLKDQQGMINVFIDLSDYYHILGNPEIAMQYAEKALAIAQEIDSENEMAWVLTSLANAKLDLGDYKGATDAHRTALESRRKMGEASRGMANLAGIARASLASGNIEEAMNCVEEILEFLETKEIEGIDQPMQVYLTCYRVLTAADDLRALEILQRGQRRLREWAREIPDAGLRQSFLENVPYNRGVTEEARRLGIED
jgi:tetratricopeptide (TPR) repeat protein